MALVKIKKLALRTIIGFNPEEREKKQDVTVRISLKFDSSKAEVSDNPDDAVNYKAITKRVIKEVEESHYQLLEALTRHILNIVMDTPGVDWAEVEVDKPHALRFADSVSITLSAQK